MSNPKTRLISPADRDLIVAWLKDHATFSGTRAEMVAAAFAAVIPGKPHPKLNSSTLHRYVSLAGLASTYERANGNKVSEPSSPLDKIHEAENAIKDALLELDAERNVLSNRIKEIDNMVAKYRKME